MALKIVTYCQNVAFKLILTCLCARHPCRRGVGPARREAVLHVRAAAAICHRLSSHQGPWGGVRRPGVSRYGGIFLHACLWLRVS